MSRTRISTAALFLVALAALAGCGDQEAKETGSCGDLPWELTAETENDTTEISFELRTRVSGETWEVVVDQDGTPILEGQQVSDEDGDLEAEASTPGSDDESTFTVTATPETGDPCTATIEH